MHFKVVDIDARHHTTIGRPRPTKFKAISRYTYVVLKMPSPNGVITMNGNINSLKLVIGRIIALMSPR